MKLTYHYPPDLQSGESLVVETVDVDGDEVTIRLDRYTPPTPEDHEALQQALDAADRIAEMFEQNKAGAKGEAECANLYLLLQAYRSARSLMKLRSR